MSLFEHDPHAQCRQTQSELSVEEGLGRAEVAVQHVDAAALDTALGDTTLAFQCLLVVIPTPQASRFFGLSGIAAHANGRNEDAFLALEVAKVTGWSFPSNLIGTPREAWDSVVALERESRSLRPITHRFYWAVNGVPATTAPAELPFLLQRVDRAGLVEASWLVQAGAPLPPRHSFAPSKLVAGGLAIAALSGGTTVLIRAEWRNERWASTLLADDAEYWRTRTLLPEWVAGGVLVGVGLGTSAGLIVAAF